MCVCVARPRSSEPWLEPPIIKPTPYGATHVAGSSNTNTLSKDEIKICQSVGKRLTHIARKLQ